MPARPEIIAALGMTMRLVSAEFRIPMAALRAGTRSKAPVARARQIAMYLAHVALSIPPPVIGHSIGRHRSSVTHACMLVEDLREEAIFDDRIGRLEAMLEGFRPFLIFHEGECDAPPAQAETGGLRRHRAGFPSQPVASMRAA